MKTAIVIPARYGSTRFPGKPLATINGRTMLSLVVDVAKKAGKNADVFVATEDQRIADHCAEIGVECVLTSGHCKTGSDRVLEAIKKKKTKYDFVINLQGDAPFTPPQIIADMIAALESNKKIEVVTPVRHLTWPELDKLRESKKTTPLSGTTAVLSDDNRALWFSKSILPIVRDEKKARGLSAESPVYQHIGLYGFRYDILEKFCSWPQTRNEALEGLEQLRLLENGVTIHTIFAKEPVHSGIDSPEDIKRTENKI
ncbi:MAG: 3-deoxy-manno-octulosonate cytidylyltransferase [Alphaproteobacteria bacterium PRO2]|nr:3-deoxy-manno-octulosonate cytidylyltransferase [Alphaproteobacteria bacterium PRO2]